MTTKAIDECLEAVAEALLPFMAYGIDRHDAAKAAIAAYMRNQWRPIEKIREYINDQMERCHEWGLEASHCDDEVDQAAASRDYNRWARLWNLFNIPPAPNQPAKEGGGE